MAYKTKLVKVNSKRPEKEIIRKAVRLLKKGELVAFPTETVYGLGANAFDIKAVRKIFKVKGRPSDNPLIVHIADVSDLGGVAREIPAVAKKLAKKFWPGPLTIVLKKQKKISNAVTASGDTVGVRIPQNEIARALIRLARVPLAAPSANASTRPSPTEAAHVLEDLSGKIPLILDGGKTRVGVESTVIDCTVTPPAILRDGGTSREQIKLVLGKVAPKTGGTVRKVRSPGQKYKHYAPRALLVLVRGTGRALVKKTILTVSGYKGKKENIIILCSVEHLAFYRRLGFFVFSFGSSSRPATVARNIFRLLRECDKKGAHTIVVEGISQKGIGMAVMDRLSRAATKII